MAVDGMVRSGEDRGEGIKDALFSALVEDEGLPQGETLEEHDRKHHHGHFDPSKSKCKFREGLEKSAETDKGDMLEVDKGGRGKGNGESRKSAFVTQRESAANPEARKQGEGRNNGGETRASIANGGEVAAKIGYGYEDVRDGLAKLIRGTDEIAAQRVIDDYFQGVFDDYDWWDEQQNKVDGFGAVRVSNTKRFVAAVIRELGAKYPKVIEAVRDVEFLPTFYDETETEIVQAAVTMGDQAEGESSAMLFGWAGSDIGTYDFMWAGHRKKPWAAADRARGILTANRATFMHEVGHLFYGRGNTKKEWLKLIRDSADKGWTKKVSGYGDTTREELHCECMAWYTMPEYKKGSLPEAVEEFLEWELTGF